ncbi:hypothetical protein ACET3Z_019119 [Daucus carota]
MSNSRRSSNGRSPLVNQQRQITSFFTKSPSSTPSPSSILPKSHSRLNPNPNPKITSKLSPASTTTPSPSQSKRNKPVLVIGPTHSPITPRRLVDEDSVGKRVKVFWPLDKTWYEGCVKSFDTESGKHLVQYDDAEEELLDLSKEKVEWIEEGSVKKFRRLRKMSVVEDEEEEEKVESGGDGDDSTDEDWGKNAEKEVVEDEEESMELDDEDEEEGGSSVKKMPVKKFEFKKRKNGGGDEVSSSKKSKSGADVGRNKLIDQINNESGKGSVLSDKCPMGDAAERFGMRETEKFKFLSENRRDANKRRPGDVNYDPKTLYLPPQFLNSLTGGQRQWWEFKSMNMDKVLFFKMGKFYELFEMDAHVGAKELDLQYMKGTQPHCGFPEKNFSMYIEKLAQKGYRVLVVEQTETPAQLDLRRKEQGSKDKVVKREICAVVTKGTLTEGEMQLANPDASYIMAVAECCRSLSSEERRIYGVCVVDVATSKILLGQFEDDTECSILSCLLTELRPVEIIKPAKLLSPETERVLQRHTRSPLVNELVPLSQFWDAERTACEVKDIYKRINGSLSHATDSSGKERDLNYLPEVLSDLVAAGDKGMHALSALGGTIFYLKQAFIDEALLRYATYEVLPCSGGSDISRKPYMILDAAALENLEIFENSRNGGSSGTLYAQLNHCITAFGKRLLKTWLARPLYQIDLIKERQDAVAALKANLSSAIEFRKELSRLPDMERLLARIFAGSEACGRNANKVVLYEDASKKQLQEFISALRGCELMNHACFILGGTLENINFGPLHHLLTPGKGLPNVQSILKHFKNAFDWVDANNSGRIIPREGADEEYDSACQAVKGIEFNLNKHLKEQRKVLGDTSINYVTIGKDAYLLEVPESLSSSVPRDYELQSSKKGVSRYWTPSIKNFIRELSQAESEKDAKLKSILHRLIIRFCEHHDKWRQLVSTTAELDVLISLAIASDYYEGPTCQPTVSGLSNLDEVPHLAARNLGHPVLRSESLGKGTFVPNDVNIGGPDCASFILLTGPNMGGKSTFLRQVCLAVILAQVGAYVPAERFNMSPVDCIYVRMGAKDHIMAGQSTFLTELVETSSMLSSATRNSLVALDELGRGTSTSDGQAIAESVLQHFVNKVRCRGMFSTHYHRLALSYHNDPKVSLCHMACQVGEVQGLEEVTFLYKLTLGACPKSYGVNVARIAGLPVTVLKRAVTKSQDFEGMYGKQGKQFDTSNGSWEDNLLIFIRNLVNLSAEKNCNEGGVVNMLGELQRRARILLEQRVS